MDEEFVKFLATMGVGGVIAGMMFLVYRKDVRTFTDQWKGQTDLLIQVVKENSAAIASNTKTIEALHIREDMSQDWMGRFGLQSSRKSRKPEDEQP